MFGIPYALLLGLLVALLDLIPVVGSTIGGVIVALIALTVSPAIAIATFAFYLVYRFLEDYLLTPRIMARTVDVPGVLTVIATVIGATLLGIIGALIAIPVAAAIKLLIEGLAIRRSTAPERPERPTARGWSSSRAPGAASGGQLMSRRALSAKPTIASPATHTKSTTAEGPGAADASSSGRPVRPARG